MSKNQSKNLNRLIELAVLAMLIALEIALSRFVPVVSTQQIKISFAFVPVVIASYLYGIKGGAIVGGVSDVIGAVLFPVGAYFPGFTLTAVLDGVVFGFFLSKKREDKFNPFLRIFLSVLISQVVLSWGLNTLWISVMYHNPYPALLMTRLVQTVVMALIKAVLIPVFTESFSKVKQIKMLRK